MLPRDVQHYVSEISRVLRPGGKCLFSAFLLDDRARAGMASGQSAYNFDCELAGCWTVDPVTPETTVACDEPTMTSLLRRHSLLPDATRFGAWSGRRITLITATSFAQPRVRWEVSTSQESHTVFPPNAGNWVRQ